MAALRPPQTSRLPPGRRLALAWLLGLGLLALLAPVLPLPYAPGVPDLAHVAEAPTAATRHWLGTDPQGRDVLSGALFGARTAAWLTLPAAALAALLGGVAGGAAGFVGRRLPVPAWYWTGALAGLAGLLQLPVAVPAAAALATAGLWAAARFSRRPLVVAVPLDSLVLGAVAALDTIPRLVLVLVLVARGGLSVASLVLVLGLTSWSSAARLVRAAMQQVQARPFIEAARAAGLSEFRIWWHHALPHALRPLQTEFPLSLAGMLALESTLSFLGVGLAPDVPSWGQQLAVARQDPSAWWAFLAPTILLSLTILSINSLARSKTPRQFSPAAATT